MSIVTVTDEQAVKANDFIRDNAGEIAKAKAERVYLEEYRKTQKALLINSFPGGTILEKESYAYAHKDYIVVLDGLRSAVEKEEELRWKMIAAQAKIEMWRTFQANARREL